MSKFILFYYLATLSASSGMATATAEFNSRPACEAAAKQVAGKFTGIYTNMYWVCVESPQ